MNTYGTTLTATYVGLSIGDWPAHSWNVTLTRGDETMTVPFTMGVGNEQTKCGKPKPVTTRYIPRPENTCHHVRCEHAGWQPVPPDLYSILCALKADAPMGASFAEWCAEYGMDTDSTKARELYFACQTSEDRSKKFFGSDWTAILDDDDYV